MEPPVAAPLSVPAAAAAADGDDSKDDAIDDAPSFFGAGTYRFKTVGMTFIPSVPSNTVLLTCSAIAESSSRGTVGRATGPSERFVITDSGGSIFEPRMIELPPDSSANECFKICCVSGRWTLPLSTGVALFCAVSPIINVASVPPVPALRPINPPLPLPSTDRKRCVVGVAGAWPSGDGCDDDDDVSVKYDRAEYCSAAADFSTDPAAETGGGGGDGNG